MASSGFIEHKLRGYYPTSPKINGVYLEEMFAAFERLSDDDFEGALKKHRSGPKADYVPVASQISKGLGKANYSSGRLSNLFFHSLVQHGWLEVVRRGLDFDLGYSPDVNEAIRSWMITCGITLNSPDCFGLPDWQYQFIKMLHSGDVIEAHKHMAQSGPDEIKYKYRRAAEFYENVGNETARKYFCYFRLQKLNSI